MTQTLFISDLHLDDHHPQSAEIFFNFVRTYALTAQTIYILGDFFEVWVGDDEQSEFIERIKTSLQTLTKQGIKVYLMGGNRDFLLGKRFAQQTGCTLLADFTPINLYGSNVLLCHGDGLCTNDERHMIFRKYSHNKILKFLFLLLPLILRKKIGNRLRQNSKQHTKTLSIKTMDVTNSAVHHEIRHHKANFIVHGHTHRPTAVDFKVDNLDCQRIVLGSWERQGCFLRWHDNGKKELVFFN